MERIKFINILKKNNIFITDQQYTLLNKYVDLLKEKNKYVNLISRKDIENIWERHILHSISLFIYIKFPENAKVLDLGTGGGLPGIPIKILNPWINIDLVDSVQKKVTSVDEFIKSLKLQNARAICNRAEKLKDKYNIVIARAVKDVNTIYNWASKIADQNKNFLIDKNFNILRLRTPLLILYKGGNLEGEIEKLKLKHPEVQMAMKDIIINGIDQEQIFNKKLIFINL